MIRASLKSLLARKVRLALSTFAIVLGVAFVTGILMFSATLSRSFTALFDSSVGDVVVQPAGTEVVAGQATSRTLPASLEPALSRLAGVRRVDAMVSAQGVYVVSSAGKVVGGSGPPTIGGAWTGAPAQQGLPGLVITSGHAPHGGDEVVLDSTTARAAGYDLGDPVTIVTSTRTLDVHPVLVGTCDFEGGGSLNGATFAAFDTATAQRLFLDGQDAYTSFWLQADDGVSQATVAREARAVLPDQAEAVTGKRAAQDDATPLLDGIDFLTDFLLIFAGIALVVSTFIIVNTFSILVAQRSRELALLRALGASQRQVARSVQLEALVVGLVGSSAGLGLGVLLALGIRALVARLGLDLAGQSLVLTWSTVGAAYACGVLVTMVAAWLPARRTTRIAPVQALRDDVALPEASIRRRLLLGLALLGLGVPLAILGLFVAVPHAGWWVGAGVLAVLLGVTAASPVLGRPFLLAAGRAEAAGFAMVGRLAGQNALRNPRRTTATASALMIGLTLAFTVAILGSSASASVDAKVRDNFLGDFLVSSAFGEPFSPAIADRMAQVDGVRTVVRERFGAARDDGDLQAVAGVRADQVDDLRLDLTPGRADGLDDGLDDDTVLVTRTWAREHHVGVGDTVDLTVPTGRVVWRVVGIFGGSPLVPAPVVTTDATLLAAGFPDQDNYLVVFADAGMPTSALQSQLDAVVADLPVVTVKDQQAFAAEQRAPIDRIIAIIYVLLVFAVVIAVLGIVNTLALSVLERTREIGLLRAVGLSRRQLRTMIRLESVAIAVLGAGLGVALGLVFGVTLMYALRDQGLEVIRVPVGQLVGFLALSLVIGVLAAVVPARRAARLDVLTAIASD